jgi:hypothetical protein
VVNAIVATRAAEKVVTASAVVANVVASNADRAPRQLNVTLWRRSAAQPGGPIDYVPESA